MGGLRRRFAKERPRQGGQEASAPAPGSLSHALSRETSPRFGVAAATGRLVVLIPIGAVEPHGPHLGLGTDVAISEGAAQAAAQRLQARGMEARVAPAIPYGVTECAAGF